MCLVQCIHQCSLQIWHVGKPEHPTAIKKRTNDLPRLFYTMLDLSRNWNRNKWWLFDRLVESPHKTSFFIRRYSTNEAEGVEMDEAAEFW